MTRNDNRNHVMMNKGVDGITPDNAFAISFHRIS